MYYYYFVVVDLHALLRPSWHHGDIAENLSWEDSALAGLPSLLACQSSTMCTPGTAIHTVRMLAYGLEVLVLLPPSNCMPKGRVLKDADVMPMMPP